MAAMGSSQDPESRALRLVGGKSTGARAAQTTGALPRRINENLESSGTGKMFVNHSNINYSIEMY